jgi:hypothetical protein
MIKFTRTVDYDSNGKPNTETVVLGVGTTLYTQANSERIMSDIWEYITSVYYWDADAGAIKSMWLGDNTEYTIDCEFDSIKEDVRRAIFHRIYKNHLAKAEHSANIPDKGRTVKVVRGKTAKGVEGKVVVAIERPYGMGWRTSLEMKLGIALDDEMTTYTAKNGKQYPTHKNMVWVWSRNCEVVNPEVDVETATRYAVSETDREVAELQRRCSQNRRVAVAA